MPDRPKRPTSGLRKRPVEARSRFVRRALRRSLAALRGTPEAAHSENEIETVLMFSLTGLALSLYLAAQIPVTGADNGLTDILMLLS